VSHPDLIRKRVQSRLAEIDVAGLRRQLRPPSGIDLSSNDYLGLAAHPLLKQATSEAVQREGLGSTGSRLLRGDRDILRALEQRFAAFVGADAALYFGSGYAANIGVLSTFLEPDDVVFSDEHNHASLIDGMRLSRSRRVIFPHLDFDALTRAVESEETAGQKFIVTESLFGMEGDIAPLNKYADLCNRTGAALIVDEAHAVGVFGKNGTGLIEDAGASNAVFLSISAAGKALGASGAFVSGPDWAIDYLIQKARSLIFSTAAPPAIAAGIEAALTIVQSEPERRATLLNRSVYIRRLLFENDIPVPEGDSQIIPVILGDNARAVTAAARLQEAGFDVRAIRPPTVPPSTARLRISMNVKITDSELDTFVEILLPVLKDSNLRGLGD
jgi:8-amino-7-oxononanoate synthase